MTDLERAKQSLQEGFERMPHTRYDLLGNAACSRKIRTLIMTYIMESATLSTCRDEVKSLMINSGAFIRFEAIVSFFLPIIMFPVMSRDRLEYRIPKMMANILSLMAIPLTVINVFLYIRFVDFRISFYDVLITSPIRLLSKMLF